MLKSTVSLHSPICSVDTRQGLINSLEYVLHASGNYYGFRYLFQAEVPTGELPGIVVQGTIEDTPIKIRFDEGTR